MALALDQLFTSGTIRMANYTNQPLDLRIIAAACTSPQELSRLLPPALYYGLNAFVLALPPLRSRSSDIPLLFELLVRKQCRLLRKTVPAPVASTSAPASSLTVSESPGKSWFCQPDISKLLCAYDWPGNIRQLESLSRRFAWIAPADPDAAWMKSFLEQEFGLLQPGHTGLTSQTSQETRNTSHPLPNQKSFIIHDRPVTYEELQALDQYYQGRRTALAQHLGISRSTLWRYFKIMEEEHKKPG